MNDLQMMGVRMGVIGAWWVIESVSLRSPDGGFRACLGDQPPDMPRWPKTYVSQFFVKYGYYAEHTVKQLKTISLAVVM